MSILARKLIRNIAANRGQFLGLASIVMVGVAIYVSMSTVYINLSRSETSFYEDYNFADYYFVAVKAPASIVGKVADLRGVAEAEGRVQKDLTLIREDGQRGVVRLTGCSYPLDRGINRFMVLKGRAFEKRSQGELVEATADKGFYNALESEGITRIEAICEGRAVKFSIVGSCASPEFIYPIQDSSNLFPKPGLFGILMVEEQQAEQILEMPGQINQIMVKFEPGADQALIRSQVEDLLKPYGFLTSIEKKNQLSNFVVDAKIKGLSTVSTVLPIIFFLVAAGIQFVIIARMVSTQRLQIGIMKALGYDSIKIVLHYASYATAASLCGALMGMLVGTLLASLIAQMYAQYFNLPEVLSGLNSGALFWSLIITVTIGSGAGLTASWRVTRINPAEAMLPETPRGSHRTILERWKGLWKRINATLKISVRSISRNRTRTAVTVLGISSTAIVLIMGFVTRDAIDFVMKRQYEQENLYNYMVHFALPIRSDETLYWKRWDEVSALEPRLEVPVKVWSGQTFDRQGVEGEDELIVGIEPGSRLKKVLNASDESIQVPDDGIILSDRTARKLNISVGQSISGETRFGIGPHCQFRLTVMGINAGYIGAASYVSLNTANRMLKEQGLCNAVMLKVDAAGENDFEGRLQEMTAVSSVISQEKDLDNVNQLLANVKYMVAVMLIFALILGGVVAFNTITMSIIERRRELASMMVMGYSIREIERMLLGDIALQLLAGLLVGLPAASWLASAYVNSIQSDMYSFPSIIYPSTYISCGLMAIVFVLSGFAAAIRRLKTIDMVEVLKEGG